MTDLSKVLELVGIDPEDFATRTRSCTSVKRFPSAAQGYVNEAHCEMRGEHKQHKCIYAGRYPMYWNDGEEGVSA